MGKYIFPFSVSIRTRSVRRLWKVNHWVMFHSNRCYAAIFDRRTLKIYVLICIHRTVKVRVWMRKNQSAIKVMINCIPTMALTSDIIQSVREWGNAWIVYASVLDLLDSVSFSSRFGVAAHRQWIWYVETESRLILVGGGGIAEKYEIFLTLIFIH